MKLNNWNFNTEAGKLTVEIGQGYFFPLESLLNTVPENFVLQMATSAMNHVGFDYNGIGTNFQGDLDPQDEPIPEGQLEVYNTSVDEQVRIQQQKFFLLLYEYFKKLQELAETPARFQEVIDGLAKHSTPANITKLENIRSVKRLPINREKYFDGPETDFHAVEKKIFLPRRHTLKVKPSQFEHNLKNLKGKLAPAVFDKIVAEGNFTESALLKTYKSPEDHAVYYNYAATPVNDFLFIVSFGEVQPTRFQFFLEGIWMVNNG